MYRECTGTTNGRDNRLTIPGRVISGKLKYIIAMHAILLATAMLVGLPILLHLIMKQEPKRLVFPAIRFLQQKRRINQRKMRLRHFFLLLLRMLLIALFGLALYQPSLTGDFGGINFSGEQPVAVAMIVDTSPSMGYTANDRSRLDEARRRALELLDDLPSGSKVAILDPADAGGSWEVSIGDARNKLEAMKEPKGVAVPVTASIANAYQLLKTVDQESEVAEPMSRLVAVFSDRTAACWDATRTDDLKKLRESIPPPAVSHLFVDVGIDEPANVAITGIELKPQIIPQGKPVLLNATIAVAGPEVEATVNCRVTTMPNLPEQKKLVKVSSGASQGVAFLLDGSQLTPGVHQVEIRLENADKLAADNIRFFTFKVAEPRKILTLTDKISDADMWQLSHAVKGEFDCEVKLADEVPNLTGYEAVCLLGVADPVRLWPKLRTYVESGGKLLVMPGPDARIASYSTTDAEAGRLLPGSLKKDTIDATTFPKPEVPKDPKAPTAYDRSRGVSWLVNTEALRHPIFAPFIEWKLQGNIDILVNPRRVLRYFDVERAPEGTVIVKYDDDDDAAKQRPALLERNVGTKGGKVLLFTTRFDTQKNPLEAWNDYWDVGNSWAVAIPNQVMRYMAGDPTDANFNFVSGQIVPVTLPRGERKAGTKLRLEGRGISGRDAEVELAENQTEYRLPAANAQSTGNFLLAIDSLKWREGFSLNAPADESTLDKVPAEAIENLFGPNSVVPIGKDLKLRDVLASKFNQPLDLFPWLLIAVLLGIAAESVLANRFYGRTPR